MSNELIELLRTVIKEELNPINTRLDNIELAISELKLGQEQLQKSLVDSLGLYSAEALNKRVFAIETQIQRISKR